MKVCIDNKTGKLLEAQSDARNGTLTENAKANGYKDVTEKEVTQSEFEALLVIANTPTPEEQKVIDTEKAKKELEKVDISSIRAIREYIASLPTAPKAIKDVELLATEIRAKL